MGDATWGGKAIPLRKRACWTGEGGEREEAGWQALRAGVRQLLAPNQVGMGIERAEGRVEERERENGLHDSTGTSWYSVQSQRRYIHVHKHTLPDYARRGSHVQVQLSQPPRAPGLGYHQAMLTLHPPLTFRPKISPGQSHNIIIILIK